MHGNEILLDNVNLASINMGRKFFVGGNWKMNGDKASIDTIIAFLKAGPLDSNTGRSSFILITSFI